MPEKNEFGPLVCDLLGIKPIGDAFKTVVDTTSQGAAAFLSRICLPAAEEFGLLLKDRVSHWRAKNANRMLEAAEMKLADSGAAEGVHAHPRLIGPILEQSSWIDDVIVSDMWAGLLASSCTLDGEDDSNLIFTNLLSQLTKAGARVLKYGCYHVKKILHKSGLVTPLSQLEIDLTALLELTGEMDIQRLDRELDHIRILGLIEPIHGGFNPHDTSRVLITPTSLALNLVVRAEGSRKSVADFFEMNVIA